jgi:hypothetical protein
MTGRPNDCVADPAPVTKGVRWPAITVLLISLAAWLWALPAVILAGQVVAMRDPGDAAIGVVALCAMMIIPALVLTALGAFAAAFSRRAPMWIRVLTVTVPAAGILTAIGLFVRC